MKTIFVTAYAVNPYKGSEEGTGWNLVCQVARFNKVIAVTRKNNRDDIEKYMLENSTNNELYSRIKFLYFDWPKWILFWKKGPLLSAIYFYLWQLSVAIWAKANRIDFDIAHSLNFHSNWTPTFLWLLGKPYVWGPVGHHPIIPKQYIKNIYGTKAWLKDRMLGTVKWCFWHLDPFNFIAKKMAVKVFTVNSASAIKLNLPQHKVVSMPAVASEQPFEKDILPKDDFTVVSVGRFVPLKGFDLTIRSFSKFYKALQADMQLKCKLLIIGTGPEKALLKKMIEDEGMQHAIEIKEWMPRREVIQQFKKASVFLFPSHEGAGMVVAEALSYGLPVVCLDNFGPGEYIPIQSSLRVKHTSYDKTVAALAQSLSVLFKNDDIYKMESKLALEQYSLLFCWNTKGNIFQNEYAKIYTRNNKLELKLA